MKTGFLFVGLAVTISAVPGHAADTPEWGQPVSGLRLSLSFGPPDHGVNWEIEVTLENVSDQDLLVPIGLILAKPHPISLQFQVETSDGKTRQVIYTALGAIAGYVEPWNVSLRPHQSFTVLTPVSDYYVLDGSEKLEAVILRPGRLWVEIDRQSTGCLAPNPKPQSFPCWHGKVVSNSVRLPN